ncbi:tRNA (adenosine(37)-N6)-threonylcarbamoyltransferase complex ATPase subunit type 1 TsaE [Leptospira biflexa]|uniref:tRNA (adenosine(37)-N6)-threonylcarbamoyltransferase complex ATPase subunit type 1 TsaE n=1 Tax=Leptospira biflexa TaxID=172 RepID=UPI0010832F75|nr:tRNA (adenosine(37)-N6)-threonylcarbamoyltransferase complex ATPase subunit type 1 TsaE [Leptospira biflexa]TGM37519.1 tRNA (adenosine(37)-N6)-threonylcarbamoyltransferase complex ATPase subunit type 1 TsaE [Leptospira biflexa]TGM40854.1 tRNA (adenosine(37)-N6)-threonylcarbamoyltransferase complex ATPase subunit type 1 TsaE [Leptospira biflexa]
MKANFLSLRETELEPVFSTLDKIVESFLSHSKSPILLFTGEMGAGKTTFIREWFSRFGTDSLINSPTFSLYNIYDSPKMRLYHFDLYRIHSIDEMENLGFEEIWGRDGVSAIEWWQKAETVLPKVNRIQITIESESFENRTYTLEWSEREIS